MCMFDTGVSIGSYLCLPCISQWRLCGPFRRLTGFGRPAARGGKRLPTRPPGVTEPAWRDHVGGPCAFTVPHVEGVHFASWSFDQMSAFGPSTAHVNPLPWARTINEHVTRSVTVALSLSSLGSTPLESEEPGLVWRSSAVRARHAPLGGTLSERGLIVAFRLLCVTKWKRLGHFGHLAHMRQHRGNGQSFRASHPG
jgi:hypothetical protein